MKYIFRFFLVIGLIFVGSNAFGQKKVMRTQKIKVNKVLLKHYKKNKIFKVSGNYIIAPKKMKFVSYKGKTLVMSKRVDSKITDKKYMTYFEQFTWNTNNAMVDQVIGTCSCDGQSVETEGDDCRFIPSNGEIRCEGACTGENDGRECTFTVTQVLNDEPVTNQIY